MTDEMPARRRQPIHTVYGGAHLFKADVCRKLGTLAQRTLEEHGPDPATFALAMGIPGELAETVYARVLEKLHREPVEDFRIDFEDGYGHRPDAEEDAAADAAAEQVALGMSGGTLPPFLGIRIKPLNEEMKARGLRTLERFLAALFEKTGGRVPENFVVTLPKVAATEQVRAMAGALERHDGISLELMVETPQAIFALPRLIEEARGRCTAAHFGAYDYTASLGIAARSQDLLHPACDFARSMMQVSLAGTGVRLSDGASNIIPVGARANVHGAWKQHYDRVRHALDAGFYQGWDLHPAQLPSRYAAVYTFFLEGLGAASERLRNFIAQAAQATLVGGVFDDAATGRGLLNYFLRAIDCGAIPEKDGPALTGLTPDQLRLASQSATKII
jgi:citrate lyase beta subunit